MVSTRPIPLGDLEISPYNVRVRGVAKNIDELAKNIRLHGLKQPIVVYRDRARGKYQILIGQRRFLAVRKIGAKTIDAIVESRPSELDAKVISFSENVQRVDLDARDKAETCSYLFSELKSVREVAKRLGVSEKTVRTWLDYAAVPESIKRLVEQKKISRPLATRIALTMEDDNRALALAKRVAELNPAKGYRDRILSAVQEMPERSVDAILQRAESLKLQKKITFILPETWGKRLDRASKELELDPGEIAKEATIEWLRLNPY